MCLWGDSCTELPISICVCVQSEVDIEDEVSDTSTTSEIVEGSVGTQHTEVRQCLNTSSSCVMRAWHLTTVKWEKNCWSEKCLSVFSWCSMQIEWNVCCIAFNFVLFELGSLRTKDFASKVLEPSRCTPNNISTLMWTLQNLLNEE